MTNGVNAPLHTPESTLGDPMLNRTPPRPQVKQLPPSHHAMLPLGKVSDPVIDRARRRFSMDDMGNRRFIEHGLR
jgi:hypothetical protein